MGIRSKIYAIKTRYLVEGNDISSEIETPTVINPADVVFDDLKFTLSKNSAKYFRPVVTCTDGQLEVVANNIFFRALTELGFDCVCCDVDESVDDAVLRSYNAEEYIPEQTELSPNFAFFYLKKELSDSTIRLLFKKIKPGQVTEPDKNVLNVYPDASCIEYLIDTNLFREESFVDYVSAIDGFISQVADMFGNLRSIIRIKKNLG